MSEKPKYLDPQGRSWNKYTCSFESPDGKYGFELWAISFEHAQLQLDALKETGRVDGEVFESGLPPTPQ